MTEPGAQRRVEGEKTRLVAWSREIRQVHDRLRAALEVVREGVHENAGAVRSGRDLLLFCHGFCVALDGHHRSEDRTLFPAVVAQHPELAPTIRKLEQDHSMIDHLLGGLGRAVEASAGPAELDRHLEGLAAVMESHFRYEERALGEILQTLRLEVPVTEALGPL